METPSPPEALKGMYVIDRLANGQLWYLWTVKDDEWHTVKCGNLETIINKLKEMEGKNGIAS